jgi:3-oxoadipate enol-lactonase
MLTSANGIKIEVDVLGEGEPSLLLVHGLGGSGRQWRGAAAALSVCRCVMPDLRGHGGSDKPAGPYSVQLWAEDLAELCAEIGLGPVVVVGASVGAAVVLRLAAERPDLVRAVVAVGGFAAMPAPAKKKMNARAEEVEAKGMAAVADAVLAAQLGASTHAGQPALAGLQRAMLLENDPKAYAAATRAVAEADVTGELVRISCPALLVWGAEEKVAPLSHQRGLKAGLPQAAVRCLPGAGHLAFFERPAAFAAVLQEFLVRI